MEINPSHSRSRQRRLRLSSMYSHFLLISHLSVISFLLVLLCPTESWKSRTWRYRRSRWFVISFIPVRLTIYLPQYCCSRWKRILLLMLNAGTSSWCRALSYHLVWSPTMWSVTTLSHRRSYCQSQFPPPFTAVDCSLGGYIYRSPPAKAQGALSAGR
jgi:hypothetical protein